MARCELYLTKLPVIGHEPHLLAGLPRALDRGIVRRALIEGVVPEVSVAVSTQLGELDRVLEQLRALGAEGYVYEESSPFERLWAGVVGRVGSRLPRPERQESNPAAAAPRAMQAIHQAAAPTVAQEALSAVPVGKLLGGALSVLVLFGAAYSLSRVKGSLDELAEGHGRVAEPERSDAAEAERLAAPPKRAAEPSSRAVAAAAQLDPGQVRSGTAPVPAHVQSPAPGEPSPALVEPIAEAPTKDGALLGPVAVAALHELRQEVRHELMVLLPMLLGVLCARWLLRGARGYARGERATAGTWASVIGSLLVVFGLAVLLVGRRAPSAPVPAASDAARAAASAGAARERRQSQLARLLGAHTAAALLASTARAPITGAHAMGESAAAASTASGTMPGSLAPAPRRPFTGLLAELRRRKHERAQQSGKGEAPERELPERELPERELPERSSARAEAPLPRAATAAVAPLRKRSASSGVVRVQQQPASDVGRAAAGGPTSSPTVAAAALPSAEPTAVPSTSTPSTTTPSVSPPSASTPSVSMPSAAAAVTPVAAASTIPAAGTQLNAGRLPAPHRPATTTERAVYAFFGGFVVALLVYGLRFVFQQRVGGAGSALSLSLALWLAPGGARVVAQQDDGAPAVSDPAHSRPSPAPAAPPAAPSTASAALGEALASALSTCVAREAGSITVEERALLAEFGPELARELAPLLSPAACGDDKLGESPCAASVRALDCEQLAAPLVAAGYDQLVEQPIDPSLSAYARALATRSVGCALGATRDEEARIGVDVLSTRLEVALASAAVVRNCRVRTDSTAGCLAVAASLPCQTLLGAREVLDTQALLGVCAELLACTPASEADATEALPSAPP